MSVDGADMTAAPFEVPRTPESAQVLRRAESLVTGERRQDYGEAARSFASLATMWSTLLGLDDAPLTPQQVALCLAALKLWRCSTSPGSMDSWVDLAGYAALGWEVAVAGEGR
jgi:hypothetical protein